MNRKLLGWGVTALMASGVPATAQTPAPPEGVPVTIARAERRDVPVFARGIGTVQAFQSVLVRARVDGAIDRIAFTEGQEVKAGDLLAVIDPRPYQAVLDQALAKRTADQALLANSKRDLARYTDLARSDFASRQSVDTQVAAVAQTTANTQGDDAAVATARLNLDFCQIKAPITGRVGLRLVDTGNLVHAADQSGIVSIAQVHPIALVFTLPQAGLPDVQAAMHGGALTVAAYSQDDKRELSRGELLTVDNAIDTTTGTIRIKAVFENADDRLWPGQFVHARLLLQTRPNVVTVPSTAIQRGSNGLYVYVVTQDGTASVRLIESGQDDGSLAIVTKGLDSGENVVTAGQSRLTNGTRVARSTTTDDKVGTDGKVGG